MNKIRNYQPYILGVVACLFVLKSFLPFGVMPSFQKEKGFTLEICLGTGTLTTEAKQIEAEIAALFGEGERQKHPAEEMADEACVFAFYTGQPLGTSHEITLDINQSKIEQYNLQNREHVVLANIARSFSVRAPPFLT